jgi:hypothetical protein
MGLDIVCCVELKVKEQWLFYNHATILQTSNVRDFLEKNKVKFKGLPDKISGLTRITYDRYKSELIYNPTWLNAIEVTELYKEVPSISRYEFQNYLFGNSYDHYLSQFIS